MSLDLDFQFTVFSLETILFGEQNFHGVSHAFFKLGGLEAFVIELRFKMLDLLIMVMAGCCILRMF